MLLSRVPDRPGGARRAAHARRRRRARNIVDVSHVREGIDLHVRETAVELVLETRGQDHADAVLAALRDAGYAEPQAAATELHAAAAAGT